MNTDIINTKTWKEISPNRKEALSYVFGLYFVSAIPETIIEVLNNNYSFEYQVGQCHHNSILFSKLYESQFECILVEGIAINANGEAFMHCWNKFKTLPSNSKPQEEEYDVTHDLLMPEQPPFLYHAIKQYNIKEIPNGTKMSFSEETEEKLNEYLAIVPDAQPKCNSRMKNLYNWEQCPISIFIKFKEKYSDGKYTKFKVYSVTENHIDAFASKNEMIFYDAFLCESHNLTDEECFACIAHELGHLLDPTPSINNMPSEERELDADKKVIELGLQEHLISALNKICPNDGLTKKRIIALKGN